MTKSTRLTADEEGLCALLLKSAKHVTDEARKNAEFRKVMLDCVAEIDECRRHIELSSISQESLN